ncbi:MAG TPA: hypothetical protein VKY37_06070 [Brumimicrobium sp.]|nr:hypothetical protein [Brumimicrobium sp.]
MDSKVENIIDLGLVNYVRHPSDPNHIVFRFADKKRADDFEKSLSENKIWFERAEEDTRNKTYFLFGIRNRDFSAVERINYDVEGRNRNFIIGNKLLRWTLVTFTIGLIILASVGYCSRTDLTDRLEEFQQTQE